MSTELLVAIGSPLLITIGGIVSWFIKSRKEDLVAAEERARESRQQVYEILMEPFVASLTFTAPEGQRQKKINKISTIEYKQAAFNLVTFGSDEMVRAFNKLMEFFFNNDLGDENEETTVKLFRVFADFLICIRTDLNTKKTNLKRSETLEFMITDIEEYRERIDRK